MALIAGALVAGAFAAPAAAHTKHYPTLVDIDWGIVVDKAAFYGTLGSDLKSCERDRKVKLFEEVPGRDEFIGSDLSGSLGGDGYEVVTDIPADTLDGTFYTTVKRKLVTPQKHRHICDPVKSASLGISH